MEMLLGQRAADFSGENEDFLIKNANIGMSLPVGNGIDLTLGLFDTIVELFSMCACSEFRNHTSKSIVNLILAGYY